MAESLRTEGESGRARHGSERKLLATVFVFRVFNFGGDARSHFHQCLSEAGGWFVSPEMVTSVNLTRRQKPRKISS